MVDNNMLVEPFARMLGESATSDVVRAIEQGDATARAVLWQTIAESGFLDALVAEESGGAGLGFADIAALAIVLGRYIVPLPIAETMVARQLLAAAGHSYPQGAIALATSLPDSANQDRRGGLPIAFGRVAEHVLVDTGTDLALVAIADCDSEPTAVYGALDSYLSFPAPVLASAARCLRPSVGLRAIAAMLRAAAIAGASAHLLEMAIAYANEREQFGKPIGRQQAIQQQLAVFAEEVVAIRMAVALAFAQEPPSLVGAAVAKSVASAAAPRLANCAHAVHAAIGISAAYDLHLYTRRLHDWRLAEGSASHWNAILGTHRLANTEDSIDWAHRL